MPFINDDAIEIVVIVEGREVFSSTAERRRKVFCATRDCYASFELFDEPDDGLCDCGERMIESDTWLCSFCGEELFDYDGAKQHLWGHIPINV